MKSGDAIVGCRRIFELESQLAGVREQAETKEAELRNALDVARQEKKALEDNASTWEAHAVTEGDQLVQQVHICRRSNPTLSALHCRNLTT